MRRFIALLVCIALLTLPMGALAEAFEWVEEPTPAEGSAGVGRLSGIRIGIDPGLSGWMMKQYLAFGDEAPDISQSDPGLKLSEDYLGAFAAGPDGKEKALTGQEIILGTGEDSNGGRLFILLADDGHVLYAPEIWYVSGADAL